MPASQDQVDVVLDYHARTKHHLHRFAASLGYLDWATHPDPFRTFDCAPSIDLPLSAARLASARYDELFSSSYRSASPVNRDGIGALFELALGLSAWKQYEKTRSALRCNPSSGNLHPTEGYAILPDVEGLDASGRMSGQTAVTKACGGGFPARVSGRELPAEDRRGWCV